MTKVPRWSGMLIMGKAVPCEGVTKGICRGVKLIFTRGHISPAVAFDGPNVIFGLDKCNYSLTRGKELGTATG